MKDFAGRTAFVTGGANGVGIGLVRALLAQGCNVAIADIRPAHIDAALQALDNPRAMNTGGNGLDQIRKPQRSGRRIDRIGIENDNRIDLAACHIAREIGERAEILGRQPERLRVAHRLPDVSELLVDPWGERLHR